MTGVVKHKEIIKAWLDGADVEFNVGHGWQRVLSASAVQYMPSFSADTEYRIKPSPVERWAITFPLLTHNAVVCFESESQAQLALSNYVTSYPGARVIKVREVIEDA